MPLRLLTMRKLALACLLVWTWDLEYSYLPIWTAEGLPILVLLNKVEYIIPYGVLCAEMSQIHCTQGILEERVPSELYISLLPGIHRENSPTHLVLYIYIHIYVD